MTQKLKRADPAVRSPKLDRPARRGRPPLSTDFQRERIMAAATRIFIERGYAASSVQVIGRAAGVTKSAIYDLVGDKEALFHAACAQLCASAGAFHFNAMSTDLPLRPILMDMATTILEAALAPSSIAFTRMLAVETLRFPDLVLSVMEVGRNDIHRKMAGVFADLAARGRIPPVDPSRAADTFYDAIVGCRAMRALLGFDEPYPPAAEIEDRVDMVLRGFIAPADDGGSSQS